MLVGMNLKTLGLILPLGFVVTACKVGAELPSPGHADARPIQRDRQLATEPTTRAAERLATAPSTQADTLDYRNWWLNFNDPELNSLITRAFKGNPSLATAVDRIREAGESRDRRVGAFPNRQRAREYSHSRTPPGVFGGVGTFGGLTSNGSFGDPFVTDLWSAGFDATWEIDVFGGTRRGIEAAKAGVQAAIEDQRDVLISL